MKIILVRLALLTLCLVAAPHLTTAAEKVAGIEVGSKGVKFTIFEIELRQRERIPKALPGRGGKDEVKNTGLNESAGQTQRYSEEAMQATTAAIKTFCDEAAAQNIKNVFVIGSSGLKEASNRDAFVQMVSKQTGRPIRFITHEEEVALTFKGVAAKDHFADSFSLDIGSGNTKFGYMKQDAPGRWSPEAGQIIYGTGALRDDVKKHVRFSDPGDAAAAATEFARSTAERLRVLKIASRLQSERQGVDLEDRNRIYLSGGIIWAMVTLLKPETIGDPDVRVTRADIDRFNGLVKQPAEKVFASVKLPAAGSPERENVEQEVASVKKVFASPKEPYAVPHADLIAGAGLLAAVADEFDFDQHQVVFPRDSLTAWIRSYVLMYANLEAMSDTADAGSVSETEADVSASDPIASAATDQATLSDLSRKIDALATQLQQAEGRIQELQQIQATLEAIRQEQELAKRRAAVLNQSLKKLGKRIDSLEKPVIPAP